MIVVDSNVIFHAIMPSEHNNDVRLVQKQDAEWNAPALWISELRSAILKYIWIELLTVKQANSVMVLARRIMLGGTGTVSDEHVLRLAADTGCSAYDSEFVAMAQQLDATLLTYDRQLLRIFPELAITPGDFLCQ